MTETQERFLRAIVARVPLDEIVEVHLFPPIRRGTLETGVAVLAVAPRPSLAVMNDGDGSHADAADAEVSDAGLAPVDDEATVSESVEVDASVDVSVDVDVDADVEVALEPEVNVSVDADTDAATADMLSAVADDRTRRLRIMTANYRATIKGPDRGKWIVDVQEEADAPLDAVEAVLRGVRQRSAEPADPELVSPEVLRAVVTVVAVAPAA